MATIHICDRCGAEINPYKSFKHNITLFDYPEGEYHDNNPI